MNYVDAQDIGTIIIVKIYILYFVSLVLNNMAVKWRRRTMRLNVWLFVKWIKLIKMVWLYLRLTIFGTFKLDVWFCYKQASSLTEDIYWIIISLHHSLLNRCMVWTLRRRIYTLIIKNKKFISFIYFKKIYIDASLLYRQIACHMLLFWMKENRNKLEFTLHCWTFETAKQIWIAN